MALDRRTRRVMPSPISLRERTADDHANDRIWQTWESLPLSTRIAVDSDTNSQFFLGNGVQGEQRLAEAIARVRVAA